VKRKGIILAAGLGSRLYPVTLATSKQLLPVFDKPMIYYPLSILMQLGIREILLIISPRDEAQYRRLLGNGEQWGVTIDYALQLEPKGIAHAYVIANAWLGDDYSVLILGDNIFYGHDIPRLFLSALNKTIGATVAACAVTDPTRYGIVDFLPNGQVCSIEEKPIHPKSNYAVTGLYFYDQQVVNLVEELTPSARGELEITDLNRLYLQQGELDVIFLNPEHTWFDAGTHESLYEASHFVKSIQESSGVKVACLDEIAYRSGWIDASHLLSFSIDN
jgi:glucose-1-phosphate thymidylyltransferase